MIKIGRKNYELYKELYLLELDNKEKINTRISVPLSILPLLVAGSIYLLSIPMDLFNTFWYTVYIVTFTILVLSLITTIFFTVRAYYNYEYKYIPSLSDIEKDSILIEDYVDRVIEYEEIELSPDERDLMVKKAIEDDLCNKFVEATDNNIALNEQKLFYLRRVGIWLMITLIAGAFCVIPATFGKTDSVLKVELLENNNIRGE